MTTRYVGIGGNDANDGLSWANRKLTLNGVEDTPVAAGDTVYVGAGTYRETLTCDVDGSSGSPITYIGDYDGSHTDGVGGIVRITGSDNDSSPARNMVIDTNGKDYRTFNGFLMDSSATNIFGIIWVDESIDNLVVEKCVLSNSGIGIRVYTSAALTNSIIRNCCAYDLSIGLFDDTTVADNTNNLFENLLIFNIGSVGIDITFGGTLIKNCTIFGGNNSVYVKALNSGQTVTVNNSICMNTANYALRATTLGHLIEDYNLVASRNNVDAGAHSSSVFRQGDARWAFEMLAGGSMLTPFDLASFSTLINVAGTSPTTADMRGTTVQGTQREWGALEYDSTLDIEAGTGGTSSVKIMPLGRVGL